MCHLYVLGVAIIVYIITVIGIVVCYNDLMMKV